MAVQNQKTARRSALIESGKPTQEALAALVRGNRYAQLSFQHIAILFGWGSNVPYLLAKQGAPVIAKKMSPELLLEWMRENAKNVSKLRL